MLILGIAILAIIAVVTVTVNAHNGDSDLIHSCVEKSRIIKIIDPGDQCKKAESALDRSISGLPGADGEDGQDVEDGETGPPGSPDDDWSGAGTGKMFPGNLGDRVGVGTSNPLEILEVAELSDTLDVLGQTPTVSIQNLSTVDGSTTGHIMFKNSAKEVVTVIASITHDADGSGANRGGVLTFHTKSGLDESVRIDRSGNVGIGLTDANSRLEVSGGYLELDTSVGTPPASDCDSPDELGRMKVDSSGGGFLYVCTDVAGSIGWVGK